ncbi:PREDICTED: atypical chemokine receptor 2 [Crocodylus porosus]|uniref:Atypical chemokine receptor 2 n=1 Tax=Crocodylus porosus TaxID=8502 RepID=A0A7M4FS31_CROPO|nr:PREDICTED: atypical chemokine receptor 2 [Crocodylus porosus]
MAMAFTSAMTLFVEIPLNMTDYEYQYAEEEDYSQFLVCRKENVVSFGKVFLPVLYSLVCLLGLVGNFLLFIILLKYTKKRRMTEVYLINLTISDLLFVATLPFWATHAASEWVFGTVLCKILSTIYTMNFYSGIFFVSCMSLDMYLEIVHAWSSRNSRTSGKCFLVPLAVWIASILLSVPDAVLMHVEKLHDGKLVCNHDYSQHSSIWKITLRFLQNVLGFLLPFLCMVFFYTRIACVLTTYKSPSKKRALQLVIILVTVFFVLWFPYNITLFLHSLQDLHVFKDCETSQHLDYAIQVTESLAFVHSCLNPLLYAFVNKRFRLYLKKILGAVFRKQSIRIFQPSETSQFSSKRTAQIEMLSITNLS